MLLPHVNDKIADEIIDLRQKIKKFKNSIEKYKKWVIAYTKELRLPMTFYTTIINAVFAVLIGAGFMLAGGNYDNKFLLNLLFNYYSYCL
jgi:hypothetical protein